MSRLSEFTSKANIVHKEIYSYTFVEYINSKTKVKIVCPIHGTFLQTPAAHVRGDKCWECGVIERAKGRKLSIEEVIVGFKEVHGNTYTYSFSDSYSNNKDLIDITCGTHGVFSQSINSHKRGRGCPSCAVSGFNPLNPAILYYLKVTTDEITCYKVGITNLTVAERFGSDMKYIQVLKTWDYNMGADAYTAEQVVLKMNKEFKYTGKNILQSGNTELFTKDVGGFDNE